MVTSLDGLTRRWRAHHRNVTTTVALCDALAEAGALPTTDTHQALVHEVGRYASELVPEQAAVLVAAGRMHLACGDIVEAVKLLVRAAELESSPDLVRLVAEALLRGGDARGAVLAFMHCVRGGVDDADTVALQACAQTFASLQAASGPDAVAREVARELGAPGSRYRLPRPRVAATIPRPPPASDHDATKQGSPDLALLRAAGARPPGQREEATTMLQPLDEVLAMALASRPSTRPLPAAKTAGEGPRLAVRPPHERLRLIAAFVAGMVVGAAILYFLGVSRPLSEPAGTTSAPASAPSAGSSRARRAPSP